MNSKQKLVQQEFLDKEEIVIKRLKNVYDQGLKDLNANISNLQFTINGLQATYDWLADGDPKKEVVKSMIQSKIYQKQYQEALKKQISGVLNEMQVKQFTTISDYLDGCYSDGFIGTVFDLHGQGIPLIMPINQQSMVRAVQLDSKISHGLYTRLGEDIDMLKRKILGQVSRSIATGTSYSDTAKFLAGYTKIGYNNAIRIARTEGHRIQTTAAMDALESAKDKGCDVVKQWDSTLDRRTRKSHQHVDGEIRELDERFSNGLMYPGDPDGAAGEVINCRCALLQRARWALDDDELEQLKERAAYFGLDKAKDLNDFAKKYNIAIKTPEKFDITEGGKFEKLTMSDVDDYAKYIEHEFATQKMSVKELNMMWDKAIGYIQNSDGYQDINGFLRGLKAKLDNPKRQLTIRVMNRLTKNNSLQKNYIGIRKVDSSYLENVMGIDILGLFKNSFQKNAFGKKRPVQIPKDKSAAMSIVNQINALVGTEKGTITDKAFTSVSMSENLNYFTHYPITFEIQMPAGTNGVITNNLPESEFITKTDSSIEILGAEVYNDGSKYCVKIISRLRQ